MPRSARQPLALAALAGLLAAGCAKPVEPAGPDGAGRERFARQRLEDARAFLRQDRLEDAQGALERGLAVAPDHARLHRSLAELLARRGRDREARAHRERADALSPPPPPLPEEPLDLPSRGLRIALLPAQAEGESPERVPRDGPESAAARALTRRLSLRLPGAAVEHADPESVAAARRWLARRPARAVLSLRIDRAYCDETLKDGRFAVAWLRAAYESAEAPGAAFELRETLLDPRRPEDCRAEVVACVLERALAREGLREALAARAAARPAWSREALRRLFPGIGARLEVELRSGLAHLRRGDLAAAGEAFERALRLDPGDPDARAYRDEVRQTRALLADLPARPGLRMPASGVPPLRLGRGERAAAEARLAEERRRREELLAALAVLDEHVRAPGPDVLGALTRVGLANPETFGVRKARERAGGAVEARAAYAPGGELLARYYLAPGDALPVLREEDLDGDGSADRWIGYAGAARAEIWEDGAGVGSPDVHLVFARGGDPLERIEVDADRDGRPERVFRYRDGALDSEARDSDGDGAADCFERFDEGGALREREEDLDGDGIADRRSVYEDGRLVLRELRDPAFEGAGAGGCLTPPSRTPR